MLSLKRLFLLMCWMLVACMTQVTAGGQGNKSSVGECRPGHDEYSKFLDSVFPHDQGGDVYLVLRYMPIDEPEFEVVISTNQDGTHEVDYYFLSRGSAPLGEQLKRLKTTFPSDPPEGLAEHIKVEHMKIRLNPRTLSELMSAFRNIKMTPELDSRIVVDGSTYDFWYVAFSACHVLHLWVTDAHYRHDAKAHPLVRWMNRVRAAVEPKDVEKRPDKGEPVK